ncbi:hypothetical protein [Streptomyces sp. G45]|uniref:hypothetical protein n=1 Tax=Streptomyces sp. G45 TaxID=3406627 RepID=UPI003C1A120C
MSTTGTRTQEKAAQRTTSLAASSGVGACAGVVRCPPASVPRRSRALGAVWRRGVAAVASAVVVGPGTAYSL